MNKLKRIQYNCRQATFLIEKKQMTALTLREKVELRIHLAGCSVCRLYRQQSLLITLMVSHLFQGVQKTDIRLDDNYKKQMQEQIDKRMNEN